MRIALPAALTAVLLSAACGQGGGSGWNPLNWFSSSARVETMEAAPAVPGDPRPRVDQVISMSVDPMVGGAIVRATGLPPTQGFWEADLVRAEDEDGLIVFDFLIIPPLTPQRVSTQPSREITAGAFVSNRDLATAREIIVRGERSSRTSRR
jgi:hypothetical protein